MRNDSEAGVRVAAAERDDTEQSLAVTLVGAVAVATLQFGVAVSLAALVFSGPLADGAGRAASAFILGTAMASLAVGLTTRMSVVISGAQDTAAIVAAAIAAAIVATPGLGAEEQLATVLMMLVIGAVCTGLAMWAVGSLGLTEIVRFLPSPVVSGFVAGTGWLLFRGGVEVATGEHLGLRTLGDLFTGERFQLLLPALVLGLFMVVCTTTRLHNALVSVAILAGAVGFHIVGRRISTLDEIESGGWLIGPFPEDQGWSLVGPTDVSNADWGVLAGQIMPIIALVAVSLLGFLLNLSGLEPLLGEEIDMGHEVRTVGPVNVAIGAVGGLISYTLIGDTALARQLGVRGRMGPLVIAGIGLGLFIAGPGLVGLLPRGIAGGVLVGLGVSVLVSWVRTSLPRMGSVDRVISCLILLVIAGAGVLPGIALGLAAAAFMFVINHSRLSPVHQVSSGAGRSNVDRDPAAAQLLAGHADRITTIELRGYLFFGSAVGLRTVIDERFTSGSEEDRWLVLDFGRVQGLDSTAAAALASIAVRLEERGVTVVLASLDDDLADALRQGSADNAAALGIDYAHPDLDHGVEWCEDQILAAIGEVRVAGPISLPAAIRDAMIERTLAPGEVLIAAGDATRDMYFVEQGLLTAWTEATGNGNGSAPARTRLRQVRAGAILGELSFVTGSTRSATVIADTAAAVQVLHYDRLRDVSAADPEAGLAFQQYLLETLARRLTATTSAVRDLTR